MGDYKLCYVRHGWAWFADCDPTEVWGDDWNDAPYEHNAGQPYVKEGVNFIRFVYESPYETPEDKAWSGNSAYSVEQINKKQVAWLASDKHAPIFAGVTIDEFCKAIWTSDGDIYKKVDRPDELA